MTRRIGWRSSALLLSLTAPLAAQPAPNAATAAEDGQPRVEVRDTVPQTTGFEAKLRAVVGRPAGMTAQRAARLAERSSPDLEAKRAELAAARAELDQAMVGYAPRLNLTARYTRLSPIDAPSFGPDGANLVATPSPAGPLPPGAPLVAVPGSALSFPTILDQYTLQAGLVVPLTDYLSRIPETKAAAGLAAESAGQELEVTRRAARSNGRLIYYEWVRARLSRVASTQAVDQARSHVEVVRALQSAERLSKADVLRAEAALARAELVDTRATTLTQVAEDRLRAALHDPSPQPYEIGEDLFASLPSPPARALSAMVQDAYRMRPELTALERSSAALAAKAKATRVSGYPRLDAFGNAYYANPNPRYVPQTKEWHATWDVGLQLSWTPNELATTSAAGRAIEARRAALRAQSARLRDAIRNEVSAARGGLLEAHKSVSTAQRGLRAAEEAYRVRAELFRYGRGTSLELTDAETELLRARLDTINARVDLRAAQVRLDHALGR
ncbi:MAG: TolC family protein [Polyangiaceae bacterium]